MASNIFDPESINSVNNQFRQKRFRFFKSLLDTLPKPVSILDVGGTESYWKRMNFNESEDVCVTLLNLTHTSVSLKGFTSIVGNACDLSEFDDDQFDIVFSNSVIEHLFTFKNQTLMANEVRRVGKNYIIQTPNRYFPIEPHWMVPLFQFIPFRLRVFLTNNFTLGHHPKAKNYEKAVMRVKEVKLLNKNEMKILFPDGLIYEEKILGLIKSLTSYRFNP